MISGSNPLLIPKILMKNVTVSMNAPEMEIVMIEMKKKEKMVMPLMNPNNVPRTNPKTAIKISSIKLPIMLSYIMSSFTFVPLGQIIGKRLKIFQSQRKPLMGYVYDLVGSILGVILFALTNVSGIFPVYWFAILFSVGIILLLSRKKRWVYILF